MVNVQAAFIALGVSLGLGLLVGLQRERTKPHVAGLRTFALISLIGTASAIIGDHFGGWVVGAALVGLASATVVGNIFLLKRDGGAAGITTEIAIVLVFLVGVMCWTGPKSVAVVLGSATALLLHAKPFLHGIVDKLGDKDVRAIMQFVLLALVILPVLPNSTYGPEPIDVFNPFNTWLVVVLVVGISLTGYLAYRFFGAGAGIMLSGLLGGMISSTATTVSFSRRSRGSPSFMMASACVIMLAATVSHGRVIAEIGAFAPSHFRTLAQPIMILGGICGVLAIVVWFAARRKPADMPEQANPTQLKSALFFGGMYALVLMAIAGAQEYFGQSGLYVVATISGLTNMDALTLSTSRMVQEGRVLEESGWRAIVIGSISNQIFKLGIVGVIGGLRIFRLMAILFGMHALTGLALLMWW